MRPISTSGATATMPAFIQSNKGSQMGRARVLLVASEAVPLVKTGGLADVITALAAVLIDHGVDATILMPGYPAALANAIGVRQVGPVLDDLPGGAGRLLLGRMPGADVP